MKIILVIFIVSLMLTGLISGVEKDISASVEVVSSEDYFNTINDEGGSLSSLNSGNIDIENENKSFFSEQIDIGKNFLNEINEKLTFFELEKIPFIFIFLSLAFVFFIIYILFFLIKIKKTPIRKKFRKKHSKYL